MDGRELRRSVTLSEQLSVVDSASLEDLLKLREEEEIRDPSFREGGSVNQESGIAREKREGSTDSDDSNGGSVGRTLIDIILQEHEVNGSAVDGNSSSAAAWKALRDHFRLHSPGSACEAASPERLQPNSDTEPVGSALPVPEPIIVAPATAVAATEAEVPSLSSGSDNTPEDSVPGGAVDSSALVAAPEEEEEPARVSLMALLEQTDRQWGGSGGGDDISLVGAVAEEATSYMCCVCMTRHKGAAFIPCGHTFCRLCSRELWISRGNCPLCNRHIVEILDIF